MLNNYPESIFRMLLRYSLLLEDTRDDLEEPNFSKFLHFVVLAEGIARTLENLIQFFTQIFVNLF